MKIISFDRQAAGNFVPQKNINNMDRLDFEGFKKAFGGASITEQPAEYAQAPQGFSLWKTKRGVTLAIRDEA